MNFSSFVRMAIAALVVIAVASLLSVAHWLPRYDRSSNRSARGLAQSKLTNCQGCHAAVWHEWEQSYHAQAYSHPNVQAAFRHFGHDRQCESCHAPEPIFHDLTSAVTLRAAGRETGVNCMTCHELPSGGVAAAHTIVGAPCRPIASTELTSGAFCGRCHRAIHEDWQASSFAQSEKNCQFCHMPSSTDRPGGKSHLCLGGHDESLVRSGATLSTRTTGDQLIVTVGNHASGHNFPGERHNRILLVQVIERAADGQITLAEQRTIKAVTPFRGESSAEQIRFGDAFEASFSIVPPAAKAEVQLIYKLFPWYADRDALVVHRQEVELP